MTSKTKFNFLCLMVLLNIMAFNSFGQNMITGLLLDSKSKQPIVGVNIYDESNNFATVSNEDGEFQIKVKSLPIKLVFSHVSYNKTVINITNTDFQQVLLSIAVIQLPEARTGNPANAILNAVIRKALSLITTLIACF